jgi:hypothetical protein
MSSMAEGIVSGFQQICEKACVIPGASVLKPSSDNVFNTLHWFRCGPLRCLLLGGIVGVNGHVFFGEVAGPEAAGAVADAEVDAHMILALGEMKVSGVLIH